jgi:hypothetical protein
MPTSLDQFRRDVNSKRIEALQRISQVPIAVLVWGPSLSAVDPIAVARTMLRDRLIELGHLAEFSEDLCDPGSQISIFAQQIAQAEVYDVIFSIPNSIGSIAEIHDFARIPGISHKLIVFLDAGQLAGYSALSLVAAQTSASCKVERYDSAKLPECILEVALDQIRRLQEIYYISGRR